MESSDMINEASGSAESGGEVQALEEREPEAVVPRHGPSTIPSYTVEINIIMRAMFLHAGSAIDHCVFDDVLPNEHEDQQLDTTKQHDHTPDRGAVQEGHGDGEEILYSPLDGQRCFRILIVEAGERDDALQTTLSPAHLDDEHIDFEAISYCWGAPSDKGYLICNGRAVSVPTNLLAALRQIRSPNQHRMVWADAVCINQDDIEERGRQVAIMRHIFRRASRVLVWLGQDAESIAMDAFKLTCEIVKQWKPEGDLYAWETYERLTEPIDELPSILSSVGPEVWDRLRTMFDLPWFRRVWIVQEVNVARSVVVLWGDHHIAWPLIGLCAAWIVTQGWYAVQDRSTAQAYNAFFQYAILPLSGRNTLALFRELDLSTIAGAMRGSFDSTDARDRIYGVLGLRIAGNDAQHDKLILRPNYGLSLKETYIESAKAMLIHDRHLRMLTAVQHGPEIDEEWPSWVPRWDQSHAVSIGFTDDKGLYANAGELFNVENATDALFGPDGVSLRVTGLRCQTIAQVSDELKWENLTAEDLGDFWPALELITGELMDPENKYRFRPSDDSERMTHFGHTDRESLEEFPLWYEKVESCNITRFPGKYYQRLFAEFRRPDTLCNHALYWHERSSWRDVRGFEAFRGHLRSKGRPNSEIETILSAYNIIFRRRLFRCENGSWGLGPAACRPGDSIVVLFGGTVPFVLRSGSENSRASSPVAAANNEDEHSPSLAPSSWTFIGECFKPDIMKGEAVREKGLLPDYHDVDENGLVSFNSPPHNWKNGEFWDSRLDRKTGVNGVEQFVLR